MRTTLPIALIAAACSCSVASGWGGDGHEITALIAAQHLTAKGRLLVFNLLQSDPDTQSLLAGKDASDVQALGAAMARAATWADRIKRIPLGAGTSDWHFV